MVNYIKTLFLFALVAFTAKAQAQTVVGAGGINVSNATGSVVWTVGEPAVITFSNGNQQLTQGFHQATAANLVIASVSDAVFCPGETFDVVYAAAGIFGPNAVFSVELSNASGSFANPLVIGTGTGALGGTITATIPTTQASGAGYRVRVTSGGIYSPDNGANLTVLITPNPGIIVSGDPLTFCDGGSALLQVTSLPGFAYQWFLDGVAIAGANSNFYVAAVGGNYSVSATNANGCPGYTPSAAVNVLPLPEAPVTIVGQTGLCQGQSVTLVTTQSANTFYQWQKDGVNIGGANQNSFTVTQSGNYTVRVMNAAGCIATSVVVKISVTTPPVATISPTGTATICAGQSQTFSANTGSGLSYQWYLNGQPIAGATLSTYSTTVAGNYSVEVTNNGGCAVQSSVTTLNVSALPIAQIVANGATTLCDGGSVTLTTLSGTGLTYQWFLNGVAISGANGQNFNAVLAGDYAVQITNADACQAVSALQTVSIANQPDVTLTASGTAICNGQSVLLSVPAAVGNIYQWYQNGIPLPSSDSPNLTVSDAGSYSVSVTTQFNCQAFSQNVDVSVSALPVVQLSALTATTFCTGGSVTLQATQDPNYQYQWFENGAAIAGAIHDQYVAQTAGVYSVRANFVNGCENYSSTLTVVEIAAPAAPISAVGSTSVCTGQVVGLYTNDIAGYVYQWQKDGANITGANQSFFNAIENGAYTVVVTNPSFCQATSLPLIVNVVELPAALITPNGSTDICLGQSVTLVANGVPNATYQWALNGVDIAAAVGQSYNATAQGLYTVRITASGLCANTSPEVLVNVQNLPEIILQAASPTTVCDGETVSLFATGNSGLSYQWYQNGLPIAGADGSTFSATQSGFYSVVGTAVNGCQTQSNTIQIDVQTLPNVQILNGSSVLLCGTGTVALQATPFAGLSYQWYFNGVAIPNANQDAYFASTAGIYTVQVTGGNGCVGVSQSVEVLPNPLPQPVILAAGDTVVCGGQPVLLLSNIESPQYLYQWQFNDENIVGANGTAYTAMASGNYRLILSDLNGGCVRVSARQFVVQLENPIVPAILYQNGILVVAPALPNVVYQWYKNGFPIPGATNGFLSPDAEPATYSVTAFNPNGCSAASVSISYPEITSIIDPAAGFSINLYPNPATERFNVEYFGLSSHAMLEVYNLSGQLLEKRSLPNAQGRVTIETQNWPAGVYVCKFLQNGRVIGAEKLALTR